MERAVKQPDLQRIASGVECMALRTPTLPPATTTNTAIFGEEQFVVIEAATPHLEERQRLVKWIDARLARGHRFVALLLTHHHPDHIGAVGELKQRFGAPLWAHRECAQRLSLSVDRYLQGGERLLLGATTEIEVLDTPGHVPGHVAYLHTPSGWCFAGDLVAGDGTVLIDPDDGGDLKAYLESLERVRLRCTDARLTEANLDSSEVEIRGIIPAHGPNFDKPGAAIAQLIAHRKMREDRVIEALTDVYQSLDGLVAKAYCDKPPSIWPLAKQSLRAHLEKLQADGKAHTTANEHWRYAGRRDET